MKYLIIGLGIYGENLARDLVEAGNDVIGADINPEAVNDMKNYISTAYLIDSTEENQLAVLPLGNVDLVIVAIGENFGASIKTVALLKKMGVRHIYARAIDPLHEAILQSFDLDRIVKPEQRAANDLSYELEFGSSVITLGVGDDNCVMNVCVPAYFAGMSYEDVRKHLMSGFEITLVAVCRPAEHTNILGLKRTKLTLLDLDGESVQQGDVMTVFGTRKKLRALGKKTE